MASKPWELSKWKKERKNIIVEGSSCEYCGSKDNLTVHHPYKYREGYYQRYSELKDKLNIIILCKRCHFILHKFGRRLCQLCKKNYHLIKHECCYRCIQKKADRVKPSTNNKIQERDIAEEEWLNKILEGGEEKWELLTDEEIKKSKEILIKLRRGGTKRKD